MERLEEEKLNLRRQLLDHAITKRSPAHLEFVDGGKPSHAEVKVQELERVCQEERRGKEEWQEKAETLKGRLKQAQEKVRMDTGSG